MDGVRPPSLNSVSLSILAYGSLGLGSLGVPSTLAHFPTVLSHPTILFNTQHSTCNTAPFVVNVPTTAEGSMFAVGWI
uniref:Uncharacterized protein n=1 Tax=Sinocyclocheilus rhinocerous TaxID=307959 RepID=A0A673HIN0_9TELE